jgi:uncharacterized glyoxalase superfamily protein PhnB
MFKSKRANLVTISCLLPLIVQSTNLFAQGATMPNATSRSSMTEPEAPQLDHIATVFIVDAVEPCVAFWVDRFGFTAANQVPGSDGKLMFASVKRDGIEIMYQTKASVIAENPAQASELAGRSATLFITVADIDAAERAAAGAPVFKARHQTFYGSTEFYVRDPAGNVIGFAQFAKIP